MGKKKNPEQVEHGRSATPFDIGRASEIRSRSVFLKFARDAFLRVRVCEMIRDGGKDNSWRSGDADMEKEAEVCRSRL